MIKVSSDGIEDVIRRLNDIPGRGDQLVTNTAQDVFNAVFSQADKHTKSGTLIDSLSLKKEANGFTIQHDLNRAPHAEFVHWGAKPHTIEPKDKSVLRFPAGNGFAFAKSVKHPGYEGDPWLEDGQNSAEKIFNERAAELLGDD